MSLTTYEEGQLLYSPEEYGERIFVLQSGRVRLYKLSPEGRALTLMVLEPVTLFGEMTLVGHWMHDSFAEAMTDCVIGVIRRDVMREILMHYPQVALRFMELMGQRLREIQNKLADIAFKSVPQRLATVLLNMADLSSTSPFTMPPTVIRYTHQQLAEMIGSYRETVTKAMGDFRAAGLIRIDDEMIYLTNIERLQQLAHR
ncbi:MAG: Crp/Fnr family transcriptional regulator [Chloroflexaceae bacterium]|nr:Crp/Fnr family transcriptional regulator [Chloroflexaceae bacterium]